MREIEEFRKYLRECNDLIDSLDGDHYEILHLSVLNFIRRSVTNLSIKKLFISRCEEIHAMKKIELIFRGYVNSWEGYGIDTYGTKAGTCSYSRLKIPDYGTYTIDAPVRDKLMALKKLIEDAIHYFNLVAEGNGSSFNGLFNAL